MALSDLHSTDEQRSKSRWIVMKFGGSSVGDPKHWKTISKQVQRQIQLGNKPLVVLSALKNVSNLLESLLHQSLAGVQASAIFHLKEFHFSFCSQLGLNLKDKLEAWFLELEADCQAIYHSQEITPMLHAKILAVGELLSSTIGNAYLNHRFMGQQEPFCSWQDARLLLKSKESPNRLKNQWHHYISGKCEYEYDSLFAERLEALSDRNSVVVTQGFIASDANNSTILLGREGSDTSAAYLASLLGAIEIQIWTDVPGVFSCNPQSNSGARQIERMNYGQARQMAKLGAKVLHPRTITPAEKYSIPIVVKSTQIPEEEGTRISSLESDMKAVVSESNVTAVFLKAPFDVSDNIDSMLEQCLNKLCQLGYDLILSRQQVGQFGWLLVLKYNNSDCQEPNEEAIEKNLQNAAKMALWECSCCQNLALVSIIGEQSQINWSPDTRQKLAISNSTIDTRMTAGQNNEKAKNQWLGILGKFMQDNFETSQSLLVSSEIYLDIESAIHHEIVVKAKDSHSFGQDWMSFCE